MKKQIAASVLAVAMAFTMLSTAAFASAEDALIPTAETTGEASNAANPSAAPEQSAAETGSTRGRHCGSRRRGRSCELCFSA